MSNDIKLTPTEAAAARLEGLEIGPTVDDQPVRRMTGQELSAILLKLTQDADDEQRKGNERQAVWCGKQAAKIRREIERRSRLRNGGKAA
jgi:hypothetical protein